MKSDVKKYELCILIPCYNNIEGLKKSLKSIVYDKGNYLIVVVDDGSREEVTNEILLTTNQDLSIHIIRLPVNKGITVALNTGLQWMQDNIACDYIARLDCGDVCDQRRFYKQIEFIRENPDVYLLGSWCYFEDSEKKIRYKHRAPEQHDEIINALYFRNIFIHPTILLRFDVLKLVGLYPEEYPHAEDYAWFWKIATQVKTHVIPLYLVVSEINRRGISRANRQKQLQSRLAVLKEFGYKFALRKLGILKIRLLMIIPYPLVLYIKRVISF
jgi:glycosyltransferase involved in cell wall biosynthesis